MPERSNCTLLSRVDSISILWASQPFAVGLLIISSPNMMSCDLLVVYAAVACNRVIPASGYDMTLLMYVCLFDCLIWSWTWPGQQCTYIQL